MAYRIRWKLLRRDRERIEPEEGASIRGEGKGATALELYDGIADESIMHVDIPPGQRPIFYRKRSVGVGRQPLEPTTDAVVYGYGTRDLKILLGRVVQGDLHMWAYTKDGHVNCPEWAFDQTAVAMQLAA